MRSRRTLARALVPFAALALIAVLAGPALGHNERTSVPPLGSGSIPAYRTSGPALVVCKHDSAERIQELPEPARSYNEGLLPLCAYRYIQDAVDDAGNGDRILILPGHYTEPKSRAFPSPDPACADMVEHVPAGTIYPGFDAPTYQHQYSCPHDQNLIAILGDTNDNGICDAKCNLQIEGTGAKPNDVIIGGGYRKLNVIRADRTDGIYFRNFKVRRGDFNGLYIIESMGFVIDRVWADDNVEYGFLTFAVNYGLYKQCEASWNGDSGVYPGGEADLHWAAGGSNHPSVVIRNCNSHHNFLGYSGTAGNSVWAHDNKFHHNALGIVTDSFVPHHPGLPEDSSKYQDNRIYSNNMDVYDAEHDETCVRPVSEWPKHYVCPGFGLPTGTGILIAGGNDNVVSGNTIYNNWRYGTMLFGVPAALRDETDPSKAQDTSHRNTTTDNVMGVWHGVLRPNGLDFWWDGEGSENCWESNDGGSDGITSDPPIAGGPPPAGLPDCSLPQPPEPGFQPPARSVPILNCSQWSQSNRDPAGCDWMTAPTKP